MSLMCVINRDADGGERRKNCSLRLRAEAAPHAVGGLHSSQ